MPSYCVNKNAQPKTGDHEVHDLSRAEDCLPEPENQLALGAYSSCAAAVTAARRFYNDVNGCRFCAGDCHTT